MAIKWKDRIVEHPRRYQLVPVVGQEGVFDFVPVTGEVTEVGTPVNAVNMNSIENRISSVGKTIKIRLSANTGSNNGAWNACPFDEIVTDDFGEMDLLVNPNRLIVPDGVKLVSVRTKAFSSSVFSSSSYNFNLRLNENTILNGSDGYRRDNVQSNIISESIIISVSEGDYFELWANNGTWGEDCWIEMVAIAY